ncbi:MAG: hypothetical protein ACM3XM_01700, partial [Mycobacterium leprae]
VVRAALSAPVQNKGERPHLVRGAVVAGGSGYQVSTFGNQSSANIRSLTASNGLVKVAPETKLAAGDVVEVILISSHQA